MFGRKSIAAAALAMAAAMGVSVEYTAQERLAEGMLTFRRSSRNGYTIERGVDFGRSIGHRRKFKGSSAAKRASRQAQMRAKDAARPGRARKHAASRAHGLALQWYRRWESGMPVSFAMLDAVEEGFGVYVLASRILLKRLGPAYNFAGEASRRVVQLQGPPSPIRPAPFVRRTRSA